MCALSQCSLSRKKIIEVFNVYLNACYHVQEILYNCEVTGEHSNGNKILVEFSVKLERS